MPAYPLTPQGFDDIVLAATGVPIPANPGEHVLVVSAPGRVDKPPLFEAVHDGEVPQRPVAVHQRREVLAVVVQQGVFPLELALARLNLLLGVLVLALTAVARSA